MSETYCEHCITVTGVVPIRLKVEAFERTFCSFACLVKWVEGPKSVYIREKRGETK